MPELPEVEVVRRGLHAHVVGRRIVEVDVRHPRAVRRQHGGAREFHDLLRGRLLTGTGRRGKFLWLLTDDPDVVLCAHLGMSGQFRVHESGERAAVDHRHGRVLLDLGDRLLWFVDQRTFGWVEAGPLAPDRYGELVPGPVRGIARDALDPALDRAAVARSMRRRSVDVKRLLLDQALVSGIGNIYADESLWRAGVHPRRPADRLSQRTGVDVLERAAEVMGEALAAGGTSFDSLYVNVNGSSGYFGRGLAAYGRAGQPCPRCGTPITRESFMNRSSHFCPTCQRAPRAPH